MALKYKAARNPYHIGGRGIITPGLNTSVPLTPSFIEHTIKTVKESNGECGKNLLFAIEIMLEELKRLKLSRP